MRDDCRNDPLSKFMEQKFEDFVLEARPRIAVC
jgi:hypothetical protein